MFSFPSPRQETAFPGCVLVEGTAGLVGQFSSKFRETLKLPEGSPFKYDAMYRASVVLVLLHAVNDENQTPAIVDVIDTMNREASLAEKQTLDSEVAVVSSAKLLPTFSSSSSPEEVVEALSFEEWQSVWSYFASKMPENLIWSCFETIKKNQLWRTVADSEKK